jgi:transposase
VRARRRPNGTSPRSSPAGRRLTARECQRLRTLLAGSPREVGIAADHWSPARVGRIVRTRAGVRWSNAYAVKQLRALGIALPFTRARESRMTRARLETLRRLLTRSPQELGLTGRSWTRDLVRRAIEQRLGLKFSIQHAGRLVRSLGLRHRLNPCRRRLTPEQAHTLGELLRKHPADAGIEGERWTRLSIASLIAQTFNLRYQPSSIPRVLKRWQIEVCIGRTPRRPRLGRVEQDLIEQALARPPRESGIAVNVWSQRAIAQFVESRFGVSLSQKNVNRAMRRVNASETYRARRGGLPRLNVAQKSALGALLQHPPSEARLAVRRWTRQSLRALLQERFGATYTLAGVSRLLKTLQVKLRTLGRAETKDPATTLARGNTQAAPPFPRFGI